MMATLNLFPARVAIGTANVAGTEVPVLMTPEFFRALSDLLQRVGGPSGTPTDDIEGMSTQASSPAIDVSQFADLATFQAIESTASLMQTMQAMSDAMAMQLANAQALLSEISKRTDGLDVTAGYGDQFRVNWERPGSIGLLTANAGAFTSLSYSGQLTSSVATGTAPMVVTSTTKVANLNVDLLDGGDWATPGAIGSGTPNTGSFITLATNGVGNSNFGTDTTSSGVNLRGANSGTAGGSFWAVKNNGTNILIGGNKSAVNGGAYDATPYIFGSTTIEFSVGIKVLGGAVFLFTSSALTNGAGAGAGTITNAPAAGNPTKWIGINDNGTVRYIPAW